MKSVILVRHGKSSWKYNVSDADRPLKSRGKSDAKLVSNLFFKNNQVPEKIFSSPARRALDTCKIFAQVFNFPEDSISIERSLYDFGGENVIRFIKTIPDEVDSLMIFGHNHAFTSIANLYGNKFIDNLPTSGLVKLNFEIDNWKDLKTGTTELIIIPKELR